MIDETARSLIKKLRVQIQEEREISKKLEERVKYLEEAVKTLREHDSPHYRAGYID